jgi:RNA polymerase sigma-70 factor, ECF subfamily
VYNPVDKNTPGEGRPLEDAELVERARDGDAGAYEELVRRYQGIAARVAYLVLGAGADVEEAVQDAFVKAYYALARFRQESPFRPWLLTIVANEARNRRKSAARRTRLALRVAEDRPSGDAAPSPEAAVVEHEQREQLLEAVNAMREEDRLVIGCRYFLALSERETADTLRIPPGTVKSRLARALMRLRATLEKQEAISLAQEQGADG